MNIINFVTSVQTYFSFPDIDRFCSVDDALDLAVRT